MVDIKYPKYIYIKLTNIIIVIVLATLLISISLYTNYASESNDNKNGIIAIQAAIDYAKAQCIDERIDENVCNTINGDYGSDYVQHQGEQRWSVNVWSIDSNVYSSGMVVTIKNSVSSISSYERSDNSICDESE